MAKNMYAPAYAAFTSLYGNQYQADANGLIANVNDKDIQSLSNAGCSLYSANSVPANGLTSQQYAVMQTLVDGTNIDWDLNTKQVAMVTIAGDRTLNNPTNMKAGATYILEVIQGSGGSHLLNFGDNYVWADGIAPVLGTAIGAVNILTFLCDGTKMYGGAQVNY